MTCSEVIGEKEVWVFELVFTYRLLERYGSQAPQTAISSIRRTSWALIEVSIAGFAKSVQADILTIERACRSCRQRDRAASTGSDSRAYSPHSSQSPPPSTRSHPRSWSQL